MLTGSAEFDLYDRLGVIYIRMDDPSFHDGLKTITKMDFCRLHIKVPPVLVNAVCLHLNHLILL